MEIIKLEPAGKKKQENMQFLFQERGGALNLFPTICLRKEHVGPEIDKMNDKLRSLILEQEKAGKGTKVNSIKGGYHSDTKFFEIKNLAVKQLANLIHHNFKIYIKDLWKHDSSEALDKVWPFNIHLWGWSVLIREGGFSAPHIHPNSNVSGVYYVHTGDIAKAKSDIQNAGFLALCDPRSRAHVWPIRGHYETVNVPPIEGSMIMFPSHLEHYVIPFRGKTERISIAFNIAFEEKARKNIEY